MIRPMVLAFALLTVSIAVLVSLSAVPAQAFSAHRTGTLDNIPIYALWIESSVNEQSPGKSENIASGEPTSDSDDPNYRFHSDPDDFNSSTGWPFDESMSSASAVPDFEPAASVKRYATWSAVGVATIGSASLLYFLVWRRWQ